MHGKTTIQDFAGYEEKKQRLLAAIKSRSKDRPPRLTLSKPTSNLFRPNIKEKNNGRIDIKNFNQVLSVDPANLIAEVEGMTTYEDLVNETLKHSCLPTVVPELKTITIGGALSGCGIESSSFKYGLVHETIKEIEILLADGSVLACRPDNENKDLFFAFPNTFATLGYALKIKVQLIPAKKFVKLTRYKFTKPDLFFEEIARLCSESRRSGQFSYIDGVIFDTDEQYIIAGEFVEEAPFASDYRYMNIYYQSIRTKPVDYLTTLDYIWRWDPDWFWCSKVFYMQNPIIRFLFGKFMLGSARYAKIMHFVNRHPALGRLVDALYGKREAVIQDISVPIENAMAYYNFFKEEIGIVPVWICPAQVYSNKVSFNFCPLAPNKIHLDFGFWDSLPVRKESGFYNRRIERMAHSLKAFKSLYSTSYYTEEEFWSLYDRSLYNSLKSKYDPQHLLGDLYEKCTKKSKR